MAAATVIAHRADRNLLSENGGPIDIAVNWAKSPPYRMGFARSTAIKMTVANFETIKEQFLFVIQTVIYMENVPMELICSTGTRLGSVLSQDRRGQWS